MGSDNDLATTRREAIIWTNDGIYDIDLDMLRLDISEVSIHEAL